LGAPGELLRVPLTQGLLLTSSRGSECSSQAGLIQLSTIISLYWQNHYYFRCKNPKYRYPSHSVAYKIKIKETSCRNVFIVGRTLRFRSPKFCFRIVIKAKNEISSKRLGSNAGTPYVAAAARWSATRTLQAKRDLSRVLVLALMRFDACPETSQATGPTVLPAVSVSKRRAILSSSPLLPLSLSQLPSVSSLVPTAITATTTKKTKSPNRDDVALKRSITALDGELPFVEKKTPAAHSTAFQRSRRVQRNSRPILFMLYLLALLLEMPGHHWSVAGVETTLNLSTKTLDNSESGVAEEQHPYNEYTWELNQLNPWLSACDLAGPAPADLQGSCGPPEVPKNCPIPCRILQKHMDNLSLFDDVIRSLGYVGNTTSAYQKMQQNKPSKVGAKGNTIAPEQCLFYLEESHKQDVCRKDFGQASSWSFISPRENRYWFMSGLRLRHCCEHAAVNALAPGKGGPFEAVLNGGSGCIKAMEKLLLVDALAARLHCEFEEVLARYDCGQSYSVIYNCTHCKVSFPSNLYIYFYI
jgi:hypothetical protein